MTVQEFIKEYNEAQNKETYIKKHIIKEYIPFSKKIAYCSKLAHDVCNDSESGSYIQNTPLQYAMFNIMLIRLYTDIVFESAINDYDLLDEYNLICEIIKMIDDREYKQFDTIFQMCLSDLYENEQSLRVFVEQKIQAFGYLLDAISKESMLKE